MENDVALGPTRPWPLIQALFWTIETVAGLAAIAGGPLLFADGEAWYLGVGLSFGGMVLAYLGLAMAGLSWITALARGPVVELTAKGFRDHRVSPDIIPWSDFDWGLFYAGKGTTSLQFSTMAPIRARWPARMLAVINRALRTPPYGVMTLGTGLSTGELAAVLHRFRDSKY